VFFHCLDIPAIHTREDSLLPFQPPVTIRYSPRVLYGSFMDGDVEGRNLIMFIFVSLVPTLALSPGQWPDARKAFVTFV
jgi:hypothetical protein